MLFRSEHSSTRGILNFRAKGIKYFGALKSLDLPCSRANERNSYLYECASQLNKNMSLKLSGKGRFCKDTYFTCAKFDNIFKTKIGLVFAKDSYTRF